MIAIPNEILAQLVNYWIARFQGDSCHELDNRIALLGFRYEAASDGGWELVLPPPAELKLAFQ